MSKLHYLTALLLIILLAVVSGWIFDSMEKKPDATKQKVRHDPDYFLKNFTATTMDNKGKPAYQIKAEHLEHYPDDDSMKLEKPAFFFYQDNKKSWTATADSALVLNNNAVIHLSGNVVLNQILSSQEASEQNKNDPVQLNAEQLTIETDKNIAHTKSNVKLIKGKNYIQAKGMRADLNKNKIEFLNNTRSYYVIPAR